MTPTNPSEAVDEGGEQVEQIPAEDIKEENVFEAFQLIEQDVKDAMGIMLLSKVQLNIDFLGERGTGENDPMRGIRKKLYNNGLSNVPIEVNTKIT